MSRINPVISLMKSPLPSISQQRKLIYRPEIDEVIYVYNLLNKYIFDYKLTQPEIEMKTIRKAWGMCVGEYESDTDGNVSKLYSTMQLSDKWYCPQWMISVVAHEACHQIQWDLDGNDRIRNGLEPLLGHGPSFFKYRDKLAKFGIPLKTSFSMRKWFKYQDLFKC